MENAGPTVVFVGAGARKRRSGWLNVPGDADRGERRPRNRSPRQRCGPDQQAVITVQGIRAPRVPRSRFVPLLLRASLIGGLCAGTLIGGAAAASAGQPDTGHAGKTSVAVAQRHRADPDAGASASNGAAGQSAGKPAAAEPDRPARPHPVEPARSGTSEHAPERPRARPGPVTPADPAKPTQVEPSKPAPADPAEPARASVSTPSASDSAELQRPDESEASNSTKKPSEHAKPAKHGLKSTKNSPHELVRTTTQAPPQGPVANAVDPSERADPDTRSQDTEAKPRAPDPGARQTPLLPQDRRGKAPTPPAQPAPTFSSTSGGSINGLRYVHYTLPTAPNPHALTASALVAQRNIDPHVDTRSTEPVPSPD